MARDQREPISTAGLAVAPLFAVPAAALHLALWHWNAAAAQAALPAALVILPLSYSLSYVVGIPCVHALHRLGILNAPSVGLAGMIAGTVVGAVVALSMFPMWDWYARFFYLSMGALCGVSVGLALAPFAPRRRPRPDYPNKRR